MSSKEISLEDTVVFDVLSDIRVLKKHGDIDEPWIQDYTRLNQSPVLIRGHWDNSGNSSIIIIPGVAPYGTAGGNRSETDLKWLHNAVGTVLGNYLEIPLKLPPPIVFKESDPRKVKDIIEEAKVDIKINYDADTGVVGDERLSADGSEVSPKSQFELNTETNITYCLEASIQDVGMILVRINNYYALISAINI